MVAPLSREWVQASYTMVPPRLVTNFPDTVYKLNMEMEEGYIDSLKQAILDYILLDPNEQARLRVTLPEQVRQYISILKYSLKMFVNPKRVFTGSSMCWPRVLPMAC